MTVQLENISDLKTDFRGDLDSLLDTLSEKMDLGTLWTEYFDFVRSYSIDGMTYYHIPPAGALDFTKRDLVSFEFDPEAVEEHKRLYATINSPLTDRSRVLKGPEFWCKALDILDFNEAERSHFKNYYCKNKCYNGLVIPVHSSAGRNGCFVLKLFNNDMRLDRGDIHKLKWASLAAHEAH